MTTGLRILRAKLTYWMVSLIAVATLGSQALMADPARRPNRFIPVDRILSSKDDLLRDLTRSGDFRFEDSHGYSYEVFFPSSRPEIQTLIDTITIDLMKTELGQQICAGILNQNPQLIEMHLSVSSRAANVIAASCLWRPSAVTSMVYPSPDHVLSKLSVRPAAGQTRLYMIVVTDAPHFAFDSWTDPYTNNTVLLVRRSAAEGSDLNYAFLAQLVAHEMAIYFDSRFWPGTAEWKQIAPNLALDQQFAGNMPALETILANPLIANVFAFMRAFQVEKTMIDDLRAKGEILLPANYDYSSRQFPFLQDNCRRVCLAKYLETESANLLPLALPLVAFAPHYRTQRLAGLISAAEGPPTDAKLNAIRVLAQYAPQYIHDSIKGDFLSHLIKIPTDPVIAKQRAEAKEVFKTFLLQTDLKNLNRFANQPSPRTTEAGRFDVYHFLSRPLLSGFNVRISGGPRPRIRGGNGHLPEVRAWEEVFFGPPFRQPPAPSRN